MSKTVKATLPFTGLLSALLAALLLAPGFAFAQESGEDDGEEGDALELQDVKVTGSRLSRPPSELSGNLIVLDRAAIRASGELTLARVLRQLPQNVNATNETFGSQLNGAGNKTGAASVNLRGLGSESTLILVDGRRVGYSGILGGVTDISAIPISIVERIEILLDGASAIYGSDAVGGVVNIITRKDYAGLEVNLNYTRPDAGGFDEVLANVAGAWAWDGGRANLSVERFADSGLDSSLRESVTNRSRLNTAGQKNTEIGPQARVFTYFYDDACDEARAIVWGLDGNIITRGAYAALDPADQARATCHADITLPLGFMPGDDLNGISLFGEQEWGDEAELGVSLTPEQSYNTVSLGIDQNINESTQVHANVRFLRKDSNSESGLNRTTGLLHANSPFNPFGVRVDVQGLALGTPPEAFESEEASRFLRLGAKGSLGGWTWETEFSRSTQVIDMTRFNVRDPAYPLGVNSDGVTESILATFGGAFGLPIDEAGCQQKLAEIGGSRYTYTVFFGRGTCNIYGAPPEPINPFGDISPWIIAGLDSGSENRQTQFEAIARGHLFQAPGGPIAMVAGYDRRVDVLDSFSEFSNLYSYLGSGSATGSSPFNTEVSRINTALFAEALVPLVGADNARSGAQRFSLTLSGRWDSYSDADVEYRQTETSDPGHLNATDPGDEFTSSVGIVYRPADTLLLKANVSTSFVAPQLNQLLSKVASGPRSLFAYGPDGVSVGPITDARVIQNTGGNDKLTPETAEAVGFSVEWSPPILPGLQLKTAWSKTEFADRIARLSTGVIDRNDLPPTVNFDAASNTYFVDNRFINVAEVNRAGIDFEARYDWFADLNDFSFVFRRSYTTSFDAKRHADSEITFDLVTTRDDTLDEATGLSPVPEHQTSAQLIWSRGGMFLSLDMQGAAETRIINAANREYITRPATNYDLVLGYEFGSNTLFEAPAWLEDLAATLTVNNLTDSFAETSNYNPETGETQIHVLNPFYEWTQGRTFRLSLRLSL